MQSLWTSSLLDGSNMKGIPENPFFVSPVRSENAGVDFLALGAVGERLIAVGLPGITNVTRYLRPYMVASWIVWRFNENLKELSAQGKRLPAHERTLFRAFREKVELMFSWCNRGTVATIGNRRIYPQSQQPVEASFENPIFGPVNRASWFAAAAYGPSFSQENGLGFVAAHKSVFVPTSTGDRAARILDSIMARHPAAHARAASLTDKEISLRDVKSLQDALSLGGITAKERQLFRSVLYQEDKVGVWDGSHGNRATSIALILAAVREGKALSADEIRQTMALGLTPKGRTIHDEKLEPMRRLWFVLSLRQLQRVALERLLRWLEFQLFEHRPWCDIAVLEAVAERMVEEQWPAAKQLTVGECLDVLRVEIQNHGGPSRAPLTEQRVDQFALRTKLETKPDERHSVIPASAVHALLVCAAVVDLCIGDRAFQEMLTMGGRERISLLTLMRFASERRRCVLGQFARDVLVHFVYAQHLQTAASRVEEGKNKFRYCVDDTGLKPLIPFDSINAQLGTPDRIAHVLYLLEQCGVIASVGEGEVRYTLAS